MIDKIYPKELQFNKSDTSDSEAPFLDLNLSNDIIPTEMYDKLNGFEFDIVNFPFGRRCRSCALQSMVHIFRS